MKIRSKLALMLTFLLLPGIFSVLSAQSLCDRIGGMLMASAIADAMAGPWEGRSTEKSQQFLKRGKWIDDFADYNPWFQHHWNCYQRNAPAGTFTDDSRMRFSLASFMIGNAAVSSRPMSREQLAGYVFAQYRSAYDDFLLWDKKYADAATREDSLAINVTRKEKFLAMWFGYEIAKTATSVYVPENPPLKTPPYVRVDDKTENPDYSPEWHLEPQEPQPITGDIKYSYHLNSYRQGQELPLGLIYLLPASAYFPGRPADAFGYILSVDFFDIKNAPYYPATAVALLAELLGGRDWSSITDDVLANGIEGIVGDSGTVISALNRGLQKAITIARKHKRGNYRNRQQALKFIFELHRELGGNEKLMCSVEEMLFVAVALMEYARDDLNFLIELGVNYGRDNDTVASIAAAFGGAAHGLSSLKPGQVNKIKSVNRNYDIEGIMSRLCQVSRVE